MAITIEDISRLLSKGPEVLPHTMKKNENRIYIDLLIRTSGKTLDQMKSQQVVIQLDEEGKYVRFFAPQIFKPKRGTPIALRRACMELQSLETSVVKFEYDESDGAIQAAIDFPIEDATLSFSQLKECIEGIFLPLEEAYTALEKAAGQFE